MMLRNCLRRSFLKLDSTNKYRDFLKLPRRDYNITNPDYIDKIGRQLVQEDADQTIILNLPFENDFNLPKYLIKNGQKNLLLIIKNQYNDYANALKGEISNANSINLNVIDNVNLLILKVGHTIKKGSTTLIYSEIVEHLKKREWSDKPTAKLFMIVPDSRKFILRSFFGQISHFSNLFSNGRIELYLLISDAEYRKLGEKNEGQAFFVQSYRVLYDIELLEKFQWADLQITNNKRSFRMDKNCYFVKLIPKQSLSTDYPSGYLVHFITFLTLPHSKEKLLIAFFEALFPGIGIKFIDQGYSLFTKFKELNSDDYIKIFNLLMNEEKDAFLEILDNQSKN